jgi:predicted dehydrogenase/threonine dehydrogenase-like Zn-dependent dehydrogenase
MRQVLQHLSSGEIEIADVPAPGVQPGHLLVQTRVSLISPGTERMLVEFSRGSLLAKARSQPDKVRQLVVKIRNDGLLPAAQAVRSRLDEPMPLGYCNVGRVLEVGKGTAGFAVGDRVVTNGPHAEVVAVPATLAARIPDEVEDESAAFTVLGAIALNGVRLLEPTLGEGFAVVGLGLLGLLGVQILRANGCRVLAVDVDARRCELARTLGADVVCIAGEGDPVRAARELSRDRGVDGVLVAATAKSDAIMQQAARMCRKRGRIVLLGVVGLGLRRDEFYEKEISFRVACSYGPGRYDPSYEAQGHDYPVGFVRWTAARNFEAVLDALAQRRLDTAQLVSRRLPMADAARAYDAIVTDREALGIVLAYPDTPPPLDRVKPIAKLAAPRAATGHKPVVGVIGAGNFARQVLLPAIQATGSRIAAIASAGGLSSVHAARKLGAAEATTDATRVLESPDVDVVVIATRHDSHARLAAAALDAGKHVFVEKPLAIDDAGLALVTQAYERASGQHLMVGFNRRFAPHAIKVKQLLRGRSEPVAISMTVNAGELPPGHWTCDPEVGGGRIIGEGCHFIDLAVFLVGSDIVSVEASPVLRPQLARPTGAASIQLGFADGSVAAIQYWTNGPKSFPKERVEVFSEGRALVIDNWRILRAFDWPGAPRMWMRQDKGHGAELARFLAAVESGGAPLIPFAELHAVTRASFAAALPERESR